MADSMEFSKDIDDFINDYSFKDTKEVYTNGSELIQVFRVQQALEHYFQKETKMIDKSNFSKEQYKMDLQSAHDCGYQKGIQEAKEYKDLAEQGRLVELPVAIGDTVYQIDKDRTRCSVHNEKFDESSCQGCEEFECDSKVVYSIRELTPKSIDLIIAIIMPKLGKTVFLTKSEAE